MSNEITVKVGVEADEASLRRTKDDLDGLFSSLEDSYSDSFQAISQSSTDSFISSLDGLDQAASDSMAKTRRSLADGLDGAFSDAISDDLDRAGQVVGGFGDGLDDVMDGAGHSLAKSLLGGLSDGLSSLGKDLLGSLGLGGGGSGGLLGSLLGSGSKSAGSSLLGSLGKSSGLLSGTGSLLTSGLDSLLTSTVGADTGWGFFEALKAGASVSEALDVAGISQGGGLLSSLGSGASSLFGGGGGALGGALSAAAPVGLALGGVELGANLLGMQGPVESIMGAFGGGGGHTQASALQYVNSDMEYLQQVTQGVQEAFASAQQNADQFATTLLQEMSGPSTEMERLADRAGLGSQGLDKMVDALDPLSGKLIEASQALSETDHSIDAMTLTLTQNNDVVMGATSQTDAFRQMVEGLAGSLHLPADQAAALSQNVRGLVEQFQNGGIGVDDLSAKLKQVFAQALQQTARDGATTVDQMRALEDAIRAIPTEWTSYVNVVYQTQGQRPSFHQGGQVLHGGGMVAPLLPRFHSGAQVTGLAADEVPIIARRGEYVVRAESVNAATLPLLGALNQSGQAPAGLAAQAPQVSLHLEVHGNILGSEDNLEELARIMETKLRDIGQARYAA